MTQKTQATTVSDLLTRWLHHELARRTGYRWDSSAARYRDKRTGRFVPETRVLSTVESFNADAIAGNIGSLTDDLIDGKINLRQWQSGMASELKDGYLVNAMAGRGGRNAMTQADFGRQGGRLKAEYSALNNFAGEIEAGDLSEAQIRARAKMYGKGPRTAYYDGQTAANGVAGLTEERRNLGQADHCGPCIGFAGQGWQPIGSLPEPGTECEGRNNCKCIKIFR